MYRMLKISLSLLIILFWVAGCREKPLKPVKTIPVKKEKPEVKQEKFDSFLFVGVILHKPGLYKFNVAEKRWTEFWSNYNEQVVELSYSPDRKSAFFLTAAHLGKKSFLPYIKRIKLYLVDLDSSKVEFIKNLGNGVQVFTQWENDTNFKIVVNRLDKIVPTYINQQTYIYNVFGKELLNEVQTYDLTRNGYPRPKHNLLKYESPNGDYRIVNSSKDSTNLYLENLSEKTYNFIARTSQKLNNFAGSNDGNYLIFSTIDITAGNKTLKTKEPATSNLYIYDVKQNKIVKEWKGAGVKNFFIKNDFLIFDNGFDEKSSITIINYRTLKVYSMIKLRSGCGLRNIPELPGYNP